MILNKIVKIVNIIEVPLILWYCAYISLLTGDRSTAILFTIASLLKLYITISTSIKHAKILSDIQAQISERLEEMENNDEVSDG